MTSIVAVPALGALVLEVVDVGGSGAIKIARFVGALAHHHQAFQVGRRHGLPEKGVGATESGGGRSDAQAQCEDSGGGKARRLEEHADAVAHVVPPIHDDLDYEAIRRAARICCKKAGGGASASGGRRPGSRSGMVTGTLSHSGS